MPQNNLASSGIAVVVGVVVANDVCGTAGVVVLVSVPTVEAADDDEDDDDDEPMTTMMVAKARCKLPMLDRLNQQHLDQHQHSQRLVRKGLTFVFTHDDVFKHKSHVLGTSAACCGACSRCLL